MHIDTRPNHTGDEADVPQGQSGNLLIRCVGISLSCLHELFEPGKLICVSLAVTFLKCLNVV